MGCPHDEDSIHVLSEGFHLRHRSLYGQAAEDEAVEMVNFRVVAHGALTRPTMPPPLATGAATASARGVRPTHHERLGWVDTPVFDRRTLAPDMRIEGPAMIEEAGASVVLGPGHDLRVDRFGNLVVNVPSRTGAEDAG